MDAETLCSRLEQSNRPDIRQRVLAQLASLSDGSSSLVARARTHLYTQPRRALRLAESAVEIANRRADLRDQAAAYRAQGQALRALGRHVEALSILETAGVRAREAGDPVLACRVQLGRIDSYGWLGRFDEGVSLAAELERELAGLNARSELASVLLNLGSLHSRRDRYSEALECNRQALELIQETGDAVATADARANCAAMLLNMGRHEEALAQLEQVRAIYVWHGLDSTVAKVDANIGQIRFVSGQYSLALAAQIRAREAFAAMDQQIECAIADTDIADAYRALNLWPEALERYEQAMQILASHGVDDDHARAEQGYAAVLWNSGRYEEAFPAMDRAELIFQRHKNRVQRAHVRLQRGQALYSLGKREDARREAACAARAFERNGLAGLAAEARFLLAELDREEGKRTIRRLGALLKMAKEQQKGWLICRIERAIGLQHAQSGNVRSALLHLRAAALALEQIRTQLTQEDLTVAFLRNKIEIYEDLVGLLLKRGMQRDLREAVETIERSRSRLLMERLLNSLGAPDGGTDEIDGGHRNLIRLRAELTSAYIRANAAETGPARRLSAGCDTEAKDLTLLEQSYREELRLQDLLHNADQPRSRVALAPDTARARMSSARAFAVSAPVRVEMLQSGLRSDESLIEYYADGDSLYAFTLSGRRLEALRGLASVREVEHLKRRLRYHLQKSAIQQAHGDRLETAMLSGTNEILNRLYLLLWEPLERALNGDKLVVVPFGPLHGLPFHAFYDGGRYALDTWEFIYAPGASVWLAGVDRAKARCGSEYATSVAATPTTRTVSSCGPGLSALVMGVPGPGVELISEEIREVAELLPNSHVFCGAEATLSAFRSHAGQSEWIHLAMHAMFRDDNPLFSSLQFADGRLLARDLYGMRLQCELTTLAACHTGISKVDAGDELFGLARGFLSAGARSLAVSLWPVADAATSALMPAFYVQLRQGRSKAAALRAAQRRIREQWPHPFHWASFTLVGER